MTNNWRLSATTLAGVLATLVIVACAPDPISVDSDLLVGLTQVSANDTATPPPGGPASAGNFRGWVFGYSQGPDSVNVALSNVLVSAHLRVGGLPAAQPAAEVTSGADGDWQLPVLPGGEYVVTFRPSANSGYNGAYTIATTSAAGAWSIMLAAKD